MGFLLSGLSLRGDESAPLRRRLARAKRLSIRFDTMARSTLHNRGGQPRRIDQLDPKGHAGHHSKIWNQIQPSAESHAHGHPDGTRPDAGRHARALAAFDPASQINRSVEEQAHRFAAAGLAG